MTEVDVECIITSVSGLFAVQQQQSLAGKKMVGQEKGP